MNRAQYNYVKAGLRTFAALALILASSTASSGQITRPSKPDPLLDGGELSTCMAGADLAAGVDPTGEPVIPADVGAPPVSGAGRDYGAAGRRRAADRLSGP